MPSINDLKPNAQTVLLAGTIAVLFLLYRIEREQRRQSVMLESQNRMVSSGISRVRQAQMENQRDAEESDQDEVDQAVEEFEAAKESVSEDAEAIEEEAAAGN